MHQSLGMCCCSVVQSFGLCDPMDCSVPGFLFLHYLIFMSAELVIPYNLLILCHSFSSCPQFFPASESFPMSCLSASGGQSIGASASALVIPKNIQGWFPSGLTGLISLLSKKLSGVFSSVMFFSAKPSSWSTCHICIWLLEKS